MGWFRKRPVAVQAWPVGELLFSVGADQFDSLPDAIGSALAEGRLSPRRGGFEVRTLEGTMFARVGGWIIEGVHGELYPCDGDIFAATYEPAPQED